MIAAVIMTPQNSLLSARAFKTGETVFAQWLPNSWHRGTIVNKCKIGWYIKFNDGDEKCCSPFHVIKDRVPAPGELKVGTAVLARWITGHYFPGIIAGISGDRYFIKFDDGDETSVPINFIRKR